MQFTEEQRLKLKKFFQDPDWAIIQKAIGEKIIVLEGLKGIDDKQPAEDVKAQVRGHRIARDILLDFFKTCDMMGPESPRTSKKDEDANFN